MSSIDADSGDMVLSGIRTRRTFAMRFLMLLALVTSSAAFGQISGVRRQPLETANFPCKDLHTTMIRTTLDARSVIAPHRHPGLEVAYVAAGQVEVIIGNAPAQIVAAGGSFQIPPDLRHQVTNTGATAAVIVSTYIVNPAQPLASAAP